MMTLLAWKTREKNLAGAPLEAVAGEQEEKKQRPTQASRVSCTTGAHIEGRGRAQEHTER
jgi:hypothetical protein